MFTGIISLRKLEAQHSMVCLCSHGRCSLVVERVLRKHKVAGSIPVVGFFLRVIVVRVFSEGAEAKQSHNAAQPM